jgi:hypothetical protein
MLSFRGAFMSEPIVVFAQPFTVHAGFAASLEGRVAVLDLAFCADTDRSTYATTTEPFITALGERLAVWVDHHDHVRHADFAGAPRFVLATRAEHGATPEMITPELVVRAGPVDTVVAHGDVDGIYAAAKFLLGGMEPYPGADADARAADTRQGEMSPRAQPIDHALKANITDDAMRQTILRYLVSRGADGAAEAEIAHAAAAYENIQSRTRQWAERYQIIGEATGQLGNWATGQLGNVSQLPSLPIAEFPNCLVPALAVVDIRKETKRLDLTELLLAGQRLAPVAVVRNRNLQTGEPQVTIAAATNSGYNFVEMFGLGGGMPTRVTLPDERFEEAVAALCRARPAKGKVEKVAR